MTSSSRSIPVVYLDTCVISGLARGDIKPEDRSALETLTEFVRESRLSFCASTVAREEIDKVPAAHRASHTQQLSSIRMVLASNATWINEDPGSTGYGRVEHDPRYQALRNILPDKNDARHLFQAQQAGVWNVLTVDEKTVLSKATEIQQKTGMNVMSPSQYLASWSTGK